VNVAQPAFIEGARAPRRRAPAAEWQTYLRWHALRAAADKLPAPSRTETSTSTSASSVGTQSPAAPSPRVARHRRRLRRARASAWHRRIFVDKAFSPGPRRARSSSSNVKAALGDRLKTVDWMTEETRKRSSRSSTRCRSRSAIPTSGATIRRDIGPYSFAENWMRSAELDVRRDVAARQGRWTAPTG
jgi:predicted metalloendopeptidase